MARSGKFLAAAISLVLGAALILPAAAPAAAATGGTADLTGGFDGMALVPGEGVVLTGWVVNLTDPTATDNFIDISYTDSSGSADHATEDYSVSSPRPDIASAYPAAGPDHGFRFVWGFAPPGPLTICVSAGSRHAIYAGPDHDQFFEKPLGCRSMTMPHETITSSIASLSPNPSGAGLVFSGHVADNFGVPAPYSIDNVVHPSPYSGTAQLTITPDDGGAPISAAASFSSSTTPSGSDPTIRTFSAGILSGNVQAETPASAMPYVSGTYKVCVSFQFQFSQWKSGRQTSSCASVHLLGFDAAGTYPSSDPRFGVAIPNAVPALTPAANESGAEWYLDGRRVSTSPSYTPPASTVGHYLAGDAWFAKTGYISTAERLTAGTVQLPGVTTARAAGADRFATAVAVSRQSFPDSAQGAPTVFLASGAGFPDALAAAPAAAAARSPLLLTAQASLPASVQTELRRLHPSKIVIVGGEAAVSRAVAAQAAKVAPVTRVAGADRFSTSRALATYAFPNGVNGAFVVSGLAFPDALSAGAAAAAAHEPVLLTASNSAAIVKSTVAAAKALGARTTTIVGGPNAVSASAASALKALGPVTRLSGANRDATSLAVAATFASASTVYLASDAAFPDGLSGSAAAGLGRAPLIIIGHDCVPQSVITRISALGASRVVIVGGAAALSDRIDQLYAC